MTRPTTSCPDVGQWRAWLDREAGAEPANGGLHLAACEACRTLVADLRGNIELANGALDAVAPGARLSPAEIALARQRLELAQIIAPLPRTKNRISPPRTTKERRMPAPAALARWRLAFSGLAAAVLIGLAVATPQGRAAASDFLSLFRSQSFAVVTVNLEQAQTSLLQLDRLGTVQQSRQGMTRTQTLQSFDEASSRLGYAVLRPDPGTLPSGITQQPTISAVGGGDITFTFDRAKAQAYFQSIGRTDVSLPARFDGASLVVHVPPAVLLNYSAPGSTKEGKSVGASVPVLMIGESTLLTVESKGNVGLDEMRTFLLALPGIPEGTRQQLQHIQDWQNTLPIPVPANMVNSQTATLGSGRNQGQGVILADTSNLGNGLLWQANGHVYGVAGTLSVDQLKSIANSLH